MEWIERLRAETGDGLPEKVTAFRKGDGGAWPVWGALPRLRCPRAADPVRGQRDELLPRLSNGRANPGRPIALAPAQGRLAAASG